MYVVTGGINFVAIFLNCFVVIYNKRRVINITIHNADKSCFIGVIYVLTVILFININV